MTSNTIQVKNLEMCLVCLWDSNFFAVSETISTFQYSLLQGVIVASGMECIFLNVYDLNNERCGWMLFMVGA